MYDHGDDLSSGVYWVIWHSVTRGSANDPLQNQPKVWLPIDRTGFLPKPLSLRQELDSPVQTFFTVILHRYVLVVLNARYFSLLCVFQLLPCHPHHLQWALHHQAVVAGFPLVGVVLNCYNVELLLGVWKSDYCPSVRVIDQLQRSRGFRQKSLSTTYRCSSPNPNSGWWSAGKTHLGPVQCQHLTPVSLFKTSHED